MATKHSSPSSWWAPGLPAPHGRRCQAYRCRGSSTALQGDSPLQGTALVGGCSTVSLLGQCHQTGRRVHCRHSKEGWLQHQRLSFRSMRSRGCIRPRVCSAPKCLTCSGLERLQCPYLAWVPTLH